LRRKNEGEKALGRAGPEVVGGAIRRGSGRRRPKRIGLGGRTEYSFRKARKPNRSGAASNPGWTRGGKSVGVRKTSKASEHKDTREGGIWEAELDSGGTIGMTGNGEKKRVTTRGVSPNRYVGQGETESSNLWGSQGVLEGTVREPF